MCSSDLAAVIRARDAEHAVRLANDTEYGLGAALWTRDIQGAKDLGWADGRLRFEIFATPAPLAGDLPFEVVLNNSGKTFLIPPDKTILGVLIEAGEDPMHDCQRGDCGICQVSVIDGTPDHRDYILTDAEKATGKVMQICVSRSKTPRLVLDL